MHLDAEDLVRVRRMARSGRIQLIGPRKSLMITAMPRRRSGLRKASMATARSPRTPIGALGIVAMVRSMSCSCMRPDSAGTRSHRVAVGRSPRRSGCRRPLLRKVIAAAAATARSRFSQPVVPKSRLADMSTTSQVSSSRSAIDLADVRMGGARGDRPVHPAHVVTGLVEPRLPRLGSRAGQQAEMVTVQHAVELAAHRQLSLRSAAVSAGSRISALQ